MARPGDYRALWKRHGGGRVLMLAYTSEEQLVSYLANTLLIDLRCYGAVDKSSLVDALERVTATIRESA